MQDHRQLTTEKLLLLGFSVLIVAASWFWIHDIGPTIDERIHLAEIRHIIKPEGFYIHGPTMLPGYHYFMAFWGVLFGIDEVNGYRLINCVLSILLAYVFYALSKSYGRERPVIRALQLLLFPALFYLLPRVYTDVFSLLVLVLGFLCVQRERYFLAGVILCLSILVRQSNIVWLLFAAAMVAWTWYQRPDKFSSLMMSLLPYGLGCLGFGVFVIVNGGIAVGIASGDHQSGLFTTNVFICMFVGFLGFMPLLLLQIKRLFILLSSDAVFRVMLAMMLLVFLVTAQLSHPFNFNMHFVWNQILHVLFMNVWTKLLVFIPISLMLVTYYDMYREDVKGKLCVLFTVVSLLPIQFVEPRYYYAPLALWLLYRVEGSALAERLTLTYQAVFVIAILAISNYFGLII